MVDALSKLSSQDTSTNIAISGVEDCETAKHRKQHANKCVVNIRKRRRSPEPSTKKQGSDVERRQTVDVVNRHCSHKSCIRRSSWGSLTDGVATVCGYHKGDISGRPVINFMARCKLAGCRTWSSWGIDGKQPTHCAHHGPLEDGLVCIDSGGRFRGMPASSAMSNRTLRSSSFLVKAECLF